MTQQEMHIALAKWMGWNFYPESDYGPAYWFNKNCPRNPHPDLTLDWLHECEMKLNQGQRTQYIFNLQTICGGQEFGLNYFATKEQRLEALCRTLFPKRFQ